MDILFTHTGRHVKGGGRAHISPESYTPIFGCPMHATFNVLADKPVQWSAMTPHHTTPFKGGKADFYLVMLESAAADILCWAVRMHGSKQREDTIELASREPIPELCQTSPLGIRFMAKWGPDAIAEKTRGWFDNRYHHTFSFTPTGVDSSHKWEVIKKEVDFRGASVVDIGCHYGWFCMMAARAGASHVVGLDKNSESVERARAIAHHIEGYDAHFKHHGDLATVPDSDIILYLSVQHQFDPDYTDLEKTVDMLKRRCGKLCVELIRPPMFGKGVDVDAVMGGRPLLTYKHEVRGNRSVWVV